MRTPFLRLPIALAMLAPLPLAAQEAPRVIFCKGECYAIDARGIRTLAPKGTQFREGQRLETGPGAYVQLKLGPDCALGIGEHARVRFDQKSLRDRDVIVLDRGRIRIIGDELAGKRIVRPIELRTIDGIVALRGADLEVKKLDTTGTVTGLTYVKLNAGDANLQTGQSSVALGKEGVLGLTAGKLITDKTFSLSEVALLPSRAATPPTTPGSTLPVVTAPAATLPVLSMPVANLPIASLPAAMLPVLTVPTATLPVTTVAVYTPPPISTTLTVVQPSVLVPQKEIGVLVNPTLTTVAITPPPPNTTTTTTTVTPTTTIATTTTTTLTGTTLTSSTLTTLGSTGTTTFTIKPITTTLLR